MKIVVLGSNPSQVSSDNSAFSESTKSGRTVRGWFANFPGEIIYANVSDEPTMNNKPLRVTEIRKCLPKLNQTIKDADCVVTLGKTATEAVSMLELKDKIIIKLPHPSGRCRSYNSTDTVKTRDSIIESLASLARDMEEKRHGE